MNSFNKTAAAIIPMQTMLFFDYIYPCIHLVLLQGVQCGF